jgi:hypothetical protein
MAQASCQVGGRDDSSNPWFAGSRASGEPRGAPGVHTASMLRRGAAPALLAALLLACEEPEADYPIQFARIGDFMETAQPPQMYTTPDGSRLVVESSFQTTCEPYPASARATYVATSLRVVVSGGALTNCPQDVLGTYRYRATLTRPPQLSRVTLLNTPRRGVRDSTVFDLTVVP